MPASPQTLDLLATRRSVAPHMLGGPGPNEAEIERLLTIAARVPDHGKLVPWRFIVIAGTARERLGMVIADMARADEPDMDEGRLAKERERLSRAPLVIAVVSRAAPHPKIPDWEQILSSGAACMNLVIAANAMGYATSWLTEWFAFDRRFLDALGLDPLERIAGLVHIGAPMETPPDRPRPALADIVTRIDA